MQLLRPLCLIPAESRSIDTQMEDRQMGIACAGNGKSKPFGGLADLYIGRKLVAKQSYDVMQMVRRFSILNTRFGYIIERTIDFDWRYPFSVEFPLLDTIERCTPESLAESVTASVTTLFSGVSMEDGICYGPTVEAIFAHWSELSDDVAVCLIADSNFAGYMTELARHFILLWNFHSATALGSGFRKSPCWLWKVWDLINPENDFAACEAHMLKLGPGKSGVLPYLSPSRV